MLLLVAEANGAVRAALPDGVEVAPGPGERIERTAHNAGEFARAVAEATALGSGEVALVGGALVARARAATAEETATVGRRALLAELDTAIAGWDTATAAQRAAAQLMTMRLLRSVARRLLAE